MPGIKITLHETHRFLASTKNRMNIVKHLFVNINLIVLKCLPIL